MGITTAQFRALLSPRDLADIEGGHYPPAVALIEASHPENRPEAYLVLYIMVIRAFLKNIQGIPEPVATTHSDTR